MSDTLTRFIFENRNVRGELIQLQESIKQLLDGHDYPPILAEMLKQAAAVNALLASTLKFEGRISLQLQTQGNLKFLLVQTDHVLNFRGTVSYDSEASYSDTNFSELTKDGQLIITIEPLQGQRYQGIVALESDSLAGCIENYFEQSEQLKTRIWLFSNAEQECGLLLQALPSMSDDNDFEHLRLLADTITADELFTLDSTAIIYRLFNEETVRIFAADAIAFNCACSRDKMLTSLSMLSATDIQEIFETQEEIKVHCEFCGNQYLFTHLDVKEQSAVAGNTTQH